MNNIKSYLNLIESIDNPVIKRGGPSSSDMLNRINKNILNDLVNINTLLQEQDRTQKMLSIYLEQQALGIQALVSNLQTLISSGAVEGRGVADFFGTDFIHSDNTANVDQDYGQVTLPILSIQEKMHGIDSQGNIWVPSDSRIRSLATSTFGGTNIPGDDLFLSSLEDYLAIGSTPDRFYIGGYLATENYVYIKGILPSNLSTNNLCNRITFQPIPCFAHTLCGAYYRKTDASWNEIDISWLPRYNRNITPNGCTYLGPTRLHFPASEITQVCLILKVNGWWGLQQFGIQLAEYSPTANLVVDMSSYNPNTINTVILGGKDPSVLNRFPNTTTGSKITVNLSQVASLSSPIITALDARWN